MTHKKKNTKSQIHSNNRVETMTMYKIKKKLSINLTERVTQNWINLPISQVLIHA